MARGKYVAAASFRRQCATDERVAELETTLATERSKWHVEREDLRAQVRKSHQEVTARSEHAIREAKASCADAIAAASRECTDRIQRGLGALEEYSAEPLRMGPEEYLKVAEAFGITMGEMLNGAGDNAKRGWRRKTNKTAIKHFNALSDAGFFADGRSESDDSPAAAAYIAGDLGPTKDDWIGALVAVSIEG